MSRPAPASLARLGIGAVSDNLLPGQEIGGIAKDFVRIFRAEIQARAFRGGEPCKDDRERGSSPCRSEG